LSTVLCLMLMLILPLRRLAVMDDEELEFWGFVVNLNNR
jgi:hypothetical protein